MADTAVVSDSSGVDVSGQTTYTNNTTGRNLITKAPNPFQAQYDELEREELANSRESAETLENIKSVVRWFEAQFERESITEGEKAGHAQWERLVDLHEKRKIVEMKHQEHRARRLKLDADTKEFSSMVSSATHVLTDEGPKTAAGSSILP